MTAPLLRVTGLGVRHEGRRTWAPSSAGFELRPGEVALLLGPSGCGKSTLALAMNGLVPHAVPARMRGRVEVAGVATVDAPVAAHAATVAMVFQDPDAGLTGGTVLDEVCFGAENLLVPVDEISARAELALRTVGLWDRRDDRPETLSGGGRQRLAIAGALALGSPVLVLDEPTANLDPAGAEEVVAALADVVAAGDRAILLIEHDLDRCIGLVGRAIVLDGDGRTVLDGPVREILGERADTLAELGVWLPRTTIAAMALRDGGIPIDPLPLQPAELTAALDAIETLPPPHRDRAAAGAARAARAEPAVVVDRLSIVRRGRRILEDVSLEIGSGEFVAVVGVNGAGKTTLLHAIAGIIPPPRRTVLAAGLDPARADVRDLADRIGAVFQNPEHQFVAHTAAEELAHGLRLRDVPAAEVERRVDDLLARFGLAEVRDAHPFTLSGGQKRRLSVGTALITGPRILVLDEPTFGQDRERAAELVDLLAGLNAAGTTVLVATHDLQLVADVATRVVVMAEGRVVADGTTDAVIAEGALERAGLRLPPIATAMRRLRRHPQWRSVTRFTQLHAAVTASEPEPGLR